MYSASSVSFFISGYGASAKSESWGGQSNYPYPQSQQYDKTADNQATNQYGTANYDAYSDRFIRFILYIVWLNACFVTF